MTDADSDIATLRTIAETARETREPVAVDTALEALPTVLSGLERILAAHRPVLRVFHPTEGGFREYDRCQHCLGAAGVHECGCWADEDTEYECAACSPTIPASRGAATVTWPCQTYTQLTAAVPTLG